MVHEGQAYSFQFVAAPDDLSGHVHSFYIWRSHRDRLDDVLPAYSGQMAIFVRGSGEMGLADGPARTGEAFVLSPLQQARAFVVSGPALLFGVSLNFRGWAALTGLDVGRCGDRLIDPGQVLGPEQAARFAGLPARWQAAEIDEEAMLAELADILRASLRRLSPRHEQVIARTYEWLSSAFNPDIAALYHSLPYSERQAQRLVTRFFGHPPVRLIRRFRAVRAATLLSMPTLTPELEAEIREAFYDQAHLIREIRFFTGKTPRLLMPQDGSVVTDMLGPEGYGAVDLFGGNQDEQLRAAGAI